MHLGPVMIRVSLGEGHRVATEPVWITRPVYSRSTALKVAQLRVRIGGGCIRVPLAATVDTQPGKPGTFDQPPLRPVEGMAAG